MAAGLRLLPRLLAFSASSRPLFAAHSGALPLPVRRAGPSMPLAARARRGIGSSPGAAPPAEDEDFATGQPPPPPPKALRPLGDLSTRSLSAYLVDAVFHGL